MSPSPKPASRQRAAGAASRAQTRRRLLEAAGEEFAERGYHAATVNRIAARAGVTVQTLYLAWGSKRALLGAYMDAALSGDPDRPYGEEVEYMLAHALDPAADPRATVLQFAHLFRGLAERAALGWRLYRDAAATDPEVAADWHRLRRLRHGTYVGILRRIPADALREGLTPESATDTAWAVASPETHELLVGGLGYSLDDYEEWVGTTLTTALLAP